MAMNLRHASTSSSSPSKERASKAACYYIWAALVSTAPIQATSFSSSYVSFPRKTVGRASFVLPSLGAAASTFSTSSSSTQSTTTLRSTAIPDTTTSSDTMSTTMDAGSKLAALRKHMKDCDLDVYLVPSDDPHLSEYVPDAYMRRAFLSGFTGSAGTAVVTQTDALMWTDSRYYNEAGLQLDAAHWTLQKSGLPDTPTIPKWLATHAHEKQQVAVSNSGSSSASSEDGTSGDAVTAVKPLAIGMDPFVFAASFCKEVTDAMESTKKSESLPDVPGKLVTEQANNLVDLVWGTDRPAVPVSPFRVHPLEYAGRSVTEKVALIREQMTEKKATAAVFTTLDDVAYLLNVRAKGDIDTCPVGIAYCMVTHSDIFVYCDDQKLVNVQDHVAESGLSVQPYDQIVSDIQAHCEADKTHKVWLDGSRANFAIRNVVPESQLVDLQNAVTPMKGVKNDAELAGMREAHIVDGVAMAHFMAWLTAEINEKGRSISEVELDEVLTGYRAAQKGFVECSFPTIAGVGANGAIIHYRAQADNDLMKHLDKSAPILIDSGGQYTYGTTDVTRTWSFQEEPDQEFKDYYTRVLKGHIGLDSMTFPENTPGFVLDVYARQWLWDVGADYGHGTGHGVGAALNVHEGPFGISPRWANKEVLKAGMVVSNEPGYYEDGNFGIRIENLLEIVDVEAPATNKENSSKKKFFSFEKLTMIPMQKNLMNLDLMTDKEIEWVDNYHEEVLSKVGPRLDADSPSKRWLEMSCEKIQRK